MGGGQCGKKFGKKGHTVKKRKKEKAVTIQRLQQTHTIGSVNNFHTYSRSVASSHPPCFVMHTKIASEHTRGVQQTFTQPLQDTNGQLERGTHALGNPGQSAGKL